MKYTLVQGTKEVPFIEEVQRLLNEGWEATGGVSVVIDNKDKTFVQALILPDPAPVKIDNLGYGFRI